MEQEIKHLTGLWQPHTAGRSTDGVQLEDFLSASQLKELDRFDRAQLAEVVRVCREAPTLSEAGRVLFASSRRVRKVANDADRLRKYLARFDLDWEGIRGGGEGWELGAISQVCREGLPSPCTAGGRMGTSYRIFPVAGEYVPPREFGIWRPPS